MILPNRRRFQNKCLSKESLVNFYDTTNIFNTLDFQVGQERDIEMKEKLIEFLERYVGKELMQEKQGEFCWFSAKY